MSYSIAMVGGAGHDEPQPWIRVFWGGGAMALMAAILLYMGGAGQIGGVLQQFIVITAIPVSLIILPSLWTGPPRAASALAKEQGGLT